MGMTTPFNRMIGNRYLTSGDIPVSLTVGTFITVAGVEKEVVSTGEDETVNGNKLRNVMPGRKTVREKNANYTAVIADDGALVRGIASFTLALPAAVSLDSGWFIDVLSSTGTITVDPNGAETIDGVATITIEVGQSCRITCNGSSFYSQFKTSQSLKNVVEDITPQLGGALDANGKAVFLSKGADVASATELLILTDGNSFDVTGTTTIATIEDTADAFGIGAFIQLQFDGVLTLTHSSSLSLFGAADITVAAGDWAEFQKTASGVWVMSSFSGISSTADYQAGVSTKPSSPSAKDIADAIAAQAASFTITPIATNDTITSGSGFTVAGGGHNPVFYQCYLTCTTAEHGYTVGQRIEVTPNDGGNNSNSGVAIYLSSTGAMFGKYGSAVAVFSGIDASTGAAVAFTNASWDFTAIAYEL